MNFNLSHIPIRDNKPRKKGVTMMMDKGLSTGQVENFIDASANFTDIVKFGFGTAFLTPNLKEKIKSIDKQMHVQRGNRGKMVRVAIVGYTNVGKSTLMNLLCKSKVFAEDKLFATLDTTVRKLVIGNLPFLISDTVGFIRKLPTQLVESFKSTLDEVREADLLMHVVDITHGNFEEHKESVEKILSEINSMNKPTILVFNKIDNYKSVKIDEDDLITCLLYTSPSPRDQRGCRMPSAA